MPKETIDTTNKLIKPEDVSSSDDDVIRQLSENLQSISTEDINAMFDEQEFKHYRQLWKNRLEGMDKDSKNKIIIAAEKIPVKVETDSDGSRLIEFNLGGKKWKILDLKLKTHSDEKYYYNSGCTDNVVLLSGMWDDNVEDWENKKLRDYVKEKQKEGLYIPSEDGIRKLLEELGKKINSSSLSDQIAMLMYLTGMDGGYRLPKRDSGQAPSVLNCMTRSRFFDHDTYDISSAKLFLIACEDDDSSVENNNGVESEEVTNVSFKNIGTIAGMPVEYDESKRIVKFAGETFDLNPFEGKLSFMSKVGQYADLFRDENVRKVMLTLNI